LALTVICSLLAEKKEKRKMFTQFIRKRKQKVLDGMLKFGGIILCSRSIHCNWLGIEYFHWMAQASVYFFLLDQQSTLLCRACQALPRKT